MDKLDNPPRKKVYHARTRPSVVRGHLLSLMYLVARLPPILRHGFSRKARRCRQYANCRHRLTKELEKPRVILSAATILLTAPAQWPHARSFSLCSLPASPFSLADRGPNQIVYCRHVLTNDERLQRALKAHPIAVMAVYGVPAAGSQAEPSR
jgi:hypothetical protein